MEPIQRGLLLRGRSVTASQNIPPGSSRRFTARIFLDVLRRCIAVRADARLRLPRPCSADTVPPSATASRAKSRSRSQAWRGLAGSEKMLTCTCASPMWPKITYGREFALQTLPVIRQHLAIARERHGVIGIHLQRAGAADGIVHQFRQRVAELAEALAVGGGEREPAFLFERAGRLMRSSQASTSGSSSEERLVEQHGRACARRGFRELRAQQIERRRSRYSSMRRPSVERHAPRHRARRSSSAKKTTPASTAGGAGSKPRALRSPRRACLPSRRTGRPNPCPAAADSRRCSW
jgi:hypothetical protein